MKRSCKVQTWLIPAPTTAFFFNARLLACRWETNLENVLLLLQERGRNLRIGLQCIQRTCCSNWKAQLPVWNNSNGRRPPLRTKHNYEESLSPSICDPHGLIPLNSTDTTTVLLRHGNHPSSSKVHGNVTRDTLIGRRATNISHNSWNPNDVGRFRSVLHLPWMPLEFKPVMSTSWNTWTIRRKTSTLWMSSMTLYLHANSFRQNCERAFSTGLNGPTDRIRDLWKGHRSLL